MAFPQGENEDIVRLLLQLEVSEALKNLKDLQLSAEQLSKIIQDVANKTGLSFKEVATSLRGVTDGINQARVAAGKAPIVDSKTTTEGLKLANIEARKMKENIDDAASSGRGLNQVLRLIRGTLVAIGVFRVFNFLEESIRKATEAAGDFETSLYRLLNVERILSESGVDITFKDLTDTVEELKGLFPIFSETELTKQVSLIGIMTKDLGLSSDQILQLAQAIGILNIRSADTEDLMTTTNKVLQSIVSKGPGVGNLGVKFSEAAVTAKAVELGYLKAEQSLSDLSNTQRDFVVGQAKVAITIANVAGETDTLNQYMSTNEAKIQANKKAWDDFLKSVGQYINSFIPLVTGLLNTLASFFEHGLQISIVATSKLFGFFAGRILAFQELARGNVHSLQEMRDVAKAVTDELERELYQKFFPKEAYNDIDNATESTKKFGEALKALTEIEGFDKLIEDISRLQEKLKETEEDFAIDQARALEDYDRKVERISEDFAIKRQKIIDDSNKRESEANKKYKNNEIIAEKKFQEQMRQLQANFLLDLEDALHERDARQVLRLQKQYALDKEAAQNEYAIRKEEMAKQHQEDIARIESEKDDRLAVLAQEEKIKLRRAQEDFNRSQERAAQDHQLEMERIREQLSERLMEFAEAFGQEYGLNDERVKKLYQLLEEYYGSGGRFDALYNYSTQSAINASRTILDAINAILEAQQIIPPVVSYTSANNIGGQARGGTYLATQPTTATFGEAGPEIAQFIPLRGNSAFSAMSGMAGGGAGVKGNIRLMIDLSPDLETRIVDKSLDGVSTIIRRVENEK